MSSSSDRSVPISQTSPQGLDLAEMEGGLSEARFREVRGRVRHAAGNTIAAIEDLRRAGEIFRALGIDNPNGSCWRSALGARGDAPPGFTRRGAAPGSGR